MIYRIEINIRKNRNIISTRKYFDLNIKNCDDEEIYIEAYKIQKLITMLYNEIAYYRADILCPLCGADKWCIWRFSMRKQRCYCIFKNKQESGDLDDLSD